MAWELPYMKHKNEWKALYYKGRLQMKLVKLLTGSKTVGMRVTE